MVLASAVVHEVHVGRRGARAERLLLSRLEQRAQLCVAVIASLDRVAVDHERDVVQKRASVHVADVDCPLQRSAEGVECAD
jgi:hypothetical protein